MADLAACISDMRAVVIALCRAVGVRPVAASAGPLVVRDPRQADGWLDIILAAAPVSEHRHGA